MPSQSDPPGVAHLTVREEPGVPKGRTISKMVLRPTVRAGVALLNVDRALKTEGATLEYLRAELDDQCAKVSGGDLARPEEFLLAQAHTLDALFNELLSTAMVNTDRRVVESMMRLALKAQGQCRTTLETLAEIKNPRPIAFVKQANIAAGHQQVNNGGRAEELSGPNRLLGEADGERLDTGTTGTTGRGNPALAAVAAIDRAAHG